MLTSRVIFFKLSSDNDMSTLKIMTPPPIRVPWNEIITLRLNHMKLLIFNCYWCTKMAKCSHHFNISNTNSHRLLNPYTVLRLDTGLQTHHFHKFPTLFPLLSTCLFGLFYLTLSASACFSLHLDFIFSVAASHGFPHCFDPESFLSVSLIFYPCLYLSVVSCISYTSVSLFLCVHVHMCASPDLFSDLPGCWCP